MANQYRRTLALCLVVLSFVSLAAAQQKQDRLTPADVFNLEMATDPQISRDGEKIIYVREFSEIMSDKRCSNLWVINFDGSDNRPLTTGNFSDKSPRWSDDGKRIVYVSDRSGTPQIYMRWMDTGQTAKLTNLQTPPLSISISPDGKHIAFTTIVPSPQPNVGNVPTAPPGAKSGRSAGVSIQRRWLSSARLSSSVCASFRGRHTEASLERRL
jgi:acylaminoacyl-peptidase